MPVIDGRFFRQVAVSFIAQTGGAAFAFITGLVAARWLGSEGRGTMALVVGLPGLFVLLLGFGLDSATTYCVGSGRIEATRMGHSASLVVLLTSLLAMAIFGLAHVFGWFALLVPGVGSPLLALAMLAFPFLMAIAMWGSILLGQQRIELITLMGVVQKAVGLTLVLIVVASCGAGVWGVVLSSTLAAMVCAGALALLVQRAGVRLKPVWDRECLRLTLGFGLRSYLGNLLQFFNYRLDIFIVNYFLGVGDAGIYAVAVSVAEIIWYLPNAVGFVVFPRAARRGTEGNNLVKGAFLPTLGVSIVAAAGMALFGGTLIPVLFSVRFMEAVPPLLALLPGVVMLGAAKVLANDLAGRGFPQYNAITSGISLAVTVVADILLIPRMGVLGAAVASSLAYATSLLFTALFYWWAGHAQALGKGRVSGLG